VSLDRIMAAYILGWYAFTFAGNQACLPLVLPRPEREDGGER